ncbi:MAG: spermine/spermidine synthase domain-containing protein [Planctomycetota bacterium]|jgi:spermidine synthase
MRKALLFIFFCCGAAAMLLVLAWLRMLAPVAGFTHLASSWLAGLILLNLSLGSAAFSGRESDLPGQILRMIWLVPVLLAISLFFPFIASFLEWIYPCFGSLGESLVVRIVLCELALAVPVFILGAMLPLMHRLFVQKRERAPLDTGAIYSMFALGAALGAALAEGLLFSKYGLNVTNFIGTILLVGMFAGLYLLWRGPDAQERVEELPAPEPFAPVSYLEEVRSSALFAAVFCHAFALAVLTLFWVRIEVFFVGSQHLAAASVKIVLFFSLACGAMGGRLLSRRFSLDMTAGGIILFLSGAAVCLGLLLIPLLHSLTASFWMSRSPSWGIGSLIASLPSAACLLFLPALGLGMMLPLALGIQIRDRGPILKASGLTYGAFFFGACLGAFAAGKLILPGLSLKLGVMVSGFMVLASGLLFVLFAQVRGRIKVLLFLANLVLIWLVTWIMSMQGSLSHPVVLDSHVFHESAREKHLVLEAYREDLEGAACVVHDVGARDTILYIDALEAGTTGSACLYRHMLAHLAVMAGPNPERVLVLGYGVGSLAGSLSLYPEVRQIELVDRRAAGLEMASHFVIVNRRIGVEDPGEDGPALHVETGRDGWVHLKLADELYDIIAMEPAPLLEGDAAQSFTQDFYTLCLDRLDSGGVVCLPLSLNSVPAPLFQSLINTFVESMPGCAFFLLDETLVMLGFKEEGWRMDWTRVAAFFENGRARSELALLGFNLPEALAGIYLGDGPSMKKILEGEHRIMNGHSTALEYLALPQQETLSLEGAENLDWLLQAKASLADRSEFGQETDEAVEQRLQRMRNFALSFRLMMRGQVAEVRGTGGIPGKEGKYSEDWKNLFERAFYLNPDDRRAARGYARGLVREALLALEQSRYALALDLARKAAAVAPELWDVYKAEGFLNLAAGNVDELEQVVEILRQIKPYSNLTLAFKAELARLKGDQESEEYNRGLLARSGGLPGEEERLLSLACKAQEAGEARYAVPSLELMVELLVKGPEGVTATGRPTWNLAASADPELLEKARDELLVRLDSGEDTLLPAVIGLGFFEEEIVRDRLLEVYRSSSGSAREIVLESLARSGDVQIVVEVLNDESLPEAVRLKATQIVNEMRIQDALEPLIRLLEDSSPVLRLGAFVALLNMTRMHFDYDPDGSEASRKHAVERWQRWYRIRSGIEEPP